MLSRRLPDEHGHQLAPPAPALALEPRARFRVALDRVGRQLLDVGEDRLGQQTEHLRLDAGALGGGGQAPPRDPRAHAIGGLESVERATLAELTRAERDVDLAPGTARPGRASNQLDELSQRLGHPGPHAAPERALERARIVRDLPRDRGEDLVGGRVELGFEQIRDLGGKRAPGLGLECLCHSDE